MTQKDLDGSQAVNSKKLGNFFMMYVCTRDWP